MALNLDQTHQNFLNFLQEKGRASATILAYGNDIEQFLTFLKGKNINEIEQVSVNDIEDFKNHLLQNKYTTKSVARKLNSIKTYYKYLEKEGLIKENPSQKVEHPKYILTPPRILTKMEYRSLRDVVRNDPRMYAIVELFLQTGIRISELARLKLKDIQNNKITINAYESHITRTIPLNKPAQNAINEWLMLRTQSENDELFITKTGKPFQVRNIRTSMDRYFRLADIKNATVNDLRHTFIAHQLKAGTPLILVSKLAGHKRLSTTEKYLEFIKESNGQENMKLEAL
ncbi:tyrosine-type recombinase/integrase [Candidatus Beckwithbacteria bacterium]|nr:tyrosine-type recombinase/integrase [Candidatus Beckwithbacteria bacterium]